MSTSIARWAAPLCLALTAELAAAEEPSDACGGSGEGAYRVIDLKRADASLVLFGTRHRTDPADPVWAELERRVATLSPTIVLVEGEGPLQATRELAMLRGGEPGFLCWLAGQRGVPCQSLDLPEREEAQRLLRRHEPDEVLLFLTVRALAYFNSRPASQRPPGDIVARVLQRYGPMVGISNASATDLERASQRALHRSWEPNAVSVTWHDPRESELLTQRMSRESNELREPYMLERLLAASENGARVFAAVGEGHVCNLRSVLRRRGDQTAGARTLADPSGSDPRTGR